jgi:hypothetical protein
MRELRRYERVQLVRGAGLALSSDAVAAGVDRDLGHIPRGDVNQNVLRSIYQVRRTRDLAADPATPAHITLASSIASVRRACPAFHPLFHASYFRTADGGAEGSEQRREDAA